MATEDVLELSIKDFTDIIFDPTNPVDYASLTAGPLGKGIVGIARVNKLMEKIAEIQKQRAKFQAQLQKGMADKKVGMESNYQADITGGEKLIKSAEKNLQELNQQEKLLRDQLPKGQIEMDLNRGGVVNLMPLKY
jgi:hypothetical protein|tara:strand:+ start:495 stop:902 length:408 start_codon:yes stop_codon:yes gene_type:complete